MSIEKLMQGRTISIRDFNDFVSLCSRQDGERPLVAVQVSNSGLQNGRQKFVAFRVKRLGEIRKGTGEYYPRPENYVFDAIVREGKIDYRGDSTLPMINQIYPELINDARFRQREVLVLDPDSDLGIYVLASLEGGRLKAQAKLTELGIDPTFLQQEAQ